MSLKSLISSMFQRRGLKSRFADRRPQHHVCVATPGHSKSIEMKSRRISRWRVGEIWSSKQSQLFNFLLSASSGRMILGFGGSFGSSVWITDRLVPWRIANLIFEKPSAVLESRGRGHNVYRYFACIMQNVPEEPRVTSLDPDCPTTQAPLLARFSLADEFQRV